MTLPAIRVENLGKRYQIGVNPREYSTLREAITNVAKAPWKRFRRLAGQSAEAEMFWALKDIAFEVQPGEIVGVVGRNGAGKSTLLKILSRITEPTTGRIELNGRVVSLLEVGTGFHPELTGRENIFLNAAILGMSRREITRKFDEIVDFAEVEKFLDTPVKRYSSGMYVRLAFSVASHVEPEILLVDEVLAVGDAMFQKKCFEKMQEVTRGGHTILFVSHNLAAIRQICNKGIALQDGRLLQIGELNGVIDEYLSRKYQTDSASSGFETPSFTVESVSIRSLSAPVIRTFDPVEILVTFTPKVEACVPSLHAAILTQDYQRLASLDLSDFLSTSPVKAGERTKLGFRIENLPVLPGNYQLELHLNDIVHGTTELVPEPIPFEIVETPIYGGRKLNQWFGFIGLQVQPIANSTD